MNQNSTHQLIDTRQEIDSLGTITLPAVTLIGSNTQRALENFPCTDRRLKDEPALLHALVNIKKASALTNVELGSIPVDVGEHISRACDEALTGALDEYFVVPILEGSGGTSMNMNVNEVVANRALQLQGKQPGTYQVIHPNDHVNCGQSTNDVAPSAIKIAGYCMAGDAVTELARLADQLENKSREFAEVFRLGRTCLQDAQPMTLGQAFQGYTAVVRRASNSIEAQRKRLLHVPLGGTAIGTGLGSDARFQSRTIARLAALTGLDIRPSEDRFDGMQNLDELQRLSAELETATSAVAKVAKDLMVLSSGPNGGLAEIRLPAVQPGSSIMPGKVNPVLPMSMVQLSQLAHGNHACVVMACQDGLLEINHYELVVASRLFDTLRHLSETLPVFTNRCISGITADVERSREHLMNSYALATALVPQLGYARVSQLVKQSVNSNQQFMSLVIEQNLITEDRVEELIRNCVFQDEH